jgi:hypothetical protein
MSEQLSLLESPLMVRLQKAAKFRRSDPPTSKAAARSVNLHTLEGLVLNVLRGAYPSGMTSHEIADHLEFALVTVSPRMRPLVNKNLIVDSGERRSGVGFKTSIVWKVK